MHFDRIDQLRGFAALAVVLCHVKGSAEAVVSEPARQSLYWLSGLMGWGYLGVPLFFVISGLCIHLPAARDVAAGRNAPPRWRDFHRRRFWRLYPPYLAALVLAAVLAVASRGALPVGWRTLLAETFLVHTLHPATFNGLNAPDWTLAIEAQLYLAYPIVWLLFARLGGGRGLAAVFAVTMLFRASLNVDWVPATLENVAWEVFVARWFEWALGAWIALWTVGVVTMPRWLRMPGVAASVLALAVLTEWQMWRPGWYTIKEPLYGLAFALVVVAALDREPGEARSGALGRWLAALGVYSYSLYLVHRPLQLFFEPVVRRAAASGAFGLEPLTLSLLLMTATTPLVLAAARLFHRRCEAPCIAIARRIGRGDRPDAAARSARSGRGMRAADAA